jgi:hypothetical protein
MAQAAIVEHRVTGQAPKKGRSMVPDEPVRMADEISESMQGNGVSRCAAQTREK